MRLVGSDAGDRVGWVEGLGDLFGGRATCGEPTAPVGGHFSQQAVGAIRVARLSAPGAGAAFRVEPYPDQGHGLVAILCVAGEATLAQQGAVAALGGGDIALIDLDRPVDMHLAGRHILLRCPASAVRGRSFLPMVRPAALDGALVSLARSLMVSLSRQARHMTPNDAAAVQSICFDLFARLLDQQAAPAAPAALPPRIRDVIEAHLAEPDLTPAWIADACGTSVRGLYRHFMGLNMSVCEWIRERRLERCREDLQDPRWSGRTITEIAFRWGFNDAAHFSRAFKSRYGASPRALRSAAA
jgi:AraC-like DNA-binding protein